MRNCKLILLSVVLSGILFVNALNSKEVVSPDVGETVSSTEAEVKINWSPVWDDNEGNNEFVTRISSGDKEQGNEQENCQAPNGLGLANLFREVDKILPKTQIKAIVQSYAEDPEIKALKAFMKSPQTQKTIKVIHSSQEYQLLKDYVCHVLHIDLNKYNQLVKTLIQPQLTRADSESKKGIRGLIDAVNAVLPRQQLRELYKNLLATDEELAKAVVNLKSKQFHQLLLNVKNNVPEYQQLRQQLVALGVPIEEMHQLLANTLGWNDELPLVLIA